MEYIVDFLSTKKVEKSGIFKDLNCTAEEAEILRVVVRKFVQGLGEVPVLELLQEIYGESYRHYLPKIQLVRRLMDLGWLVPVNLMDDRIHEAGELEIISISAAPAAALLQLLEKGTIDISLPEIVPYGDHLEYLQDQFVLIGLMRKISLHRQNFSTTALGTGRLLSRLKLLKQRIQERLKVSKEPIVVEKFFEEKGLSDKERLIFLALLKEEYGGGDGQLREMNALIDLVSNDEYDKIKNRSLLEDGSRLISDKIVDYEEIMTMFGGISRSFFLHETVMRRIMHPGKKEKSPAVALEKLVEEQDIFEYIEPDRDLDDIVLPGQTREVLRQITRQSDKKVAKKLREWGIDRGGIAARLIFYGPPGTGKTLTAMGLAKSLGRPVLGLDCSRILSMYVGESEKNVRRIFDDYEELARRAKIEPVLLLNEADQFLGGRSSGPGSSADKMHNQMQNIFLERIERFRGVLVATTNLLENIDRAFARRFEYKIEFKRPDRSRRLRLWQMMLPEKADYEEGFDIKELAEYDLSGGQIELVIRNTALKVAVREESIFTIDDFREEIIKESRGSFENSSEMGFRA